MRSLRNRRAVAAAAIALDLVALAARADDGAVPQRPPNMFNRWQEDWSALADPRVPRQPFDELKYIPLSAIDPKTYLSLGADVRERFEANAAQGFGSGPNRNQDYVISRAEWHADLRLASQVQVFTQFQSDFAPWKTMLSPVDQDRLDLEQAFVALTEPVDDGTLKLRLGRQQFAFDLQRFVSVRDGPNVRQSYDAAWADYENGPWRFITFYSHPVQVQDDRAFDDDSSNRQTFGGVRLERKLSASTSLTAYYAQFTQASVRFPNASGDERRDILDLHATGTNGRIDWDLEAMGQGGRIGADSIRAWALGSLAGYTFADVGWSPRLGLQVDAASGDRNSPGHFGTFNPLFPNGYYVTLAGYTGYVNFIHVKPSLTLHPDPALKVTVAVASQWRETTADAVYTQPDIPIANTAGRSGSYTGSYGQLRLDWSVDRATAFAVEAVHFVVGDALRAAGGHDSNYLGVEVKHGW
ncbi:MAG: alginate export family protein [Xanthobacteraceae bacterium]|nr:alginate export family protein [Xanthobacteraceae bacterium]